DGETIDPHALSIAERIVKSGAVVTALGRLIEKAGLHGPTKAREVRTIAPPRDDQPPTRARRGVDPRRGPVGGERAGGGDRAERAERAEGAGRAEREWVPFRVTWGGQQGADARRLLAIACRSGNVKGSDIGAIRVEATYSFIDVARDVADAFAIAAARPHPRNPRIRITRCDPSGRAHARATHARSARRAGRARSGPHASMPLETCDRSRPRARRHRTPSLHHARTSARAAPSRCSGAPERPDRTFDPSNIVELPR